MPHLNLLTEDGIAAFKPELVAARDLDRAWRAIRLALLSLPDGATARFERSRGTHDSRQPRSWFAYELADLERRWEKAKSISFKRAVVRAASELLQEVKLPKPKPEVRQLRERFPKEFKRRVASEAQSTRVVARMYGVSHTAVANWRREFDL
jgi:hypothetical protein